MLVHSGCEYSHHSVNEGFLCTQQEVDDWCTKLHTFAITSLIEPLKLIAKWHVENDGKHIYHYSDEGMQVYRSFANEMAQVMNEQWESGIMNQGNVSKDKQTMIR